MKSRRRKLTKPAQVGGTIFGVGVSEQLVIDRAQREYIYQREPKLEAKRIKRLRSWLRKIRRVDRTNERTGPHSHRKEEK